MFAFQDCVANLGEVQTVPYSEFEKALKKCRLIEVTVGERTVEGRLKNPAAGRHQRIAATQVDPQLADKLDSHRVRYSAVGGSTWVWTLMSWAMPAVAIYLVWSLLLRALAGRAVG